MLDLKLIAAVSQNGVIGNKGDIPWKIRADMKYFQKVTMGHPVVMGSKTFTSILKRLGKPLPGRENLVLSRSRVLQGLRDFDPPGYKVIPWSEVLERAETEEIFVIGGAEVFTLAWPHVVEMHITVVSAHVSGDVYFEDFLDPYSKGNWECVSRNGPFPADDQNQYPYSIKVLRRKDP